MPKSRRTLTVLPAHPIIYEVEEILFHKEWIYERLSPHAIHAEAEGAWSTYHLSCEWNDQEESLEFNLSIESPLGKIPLNKLMELLMGVNASLWFGSFIIDPEDQEPVFRYTILSRGAPLATRNLLDYIIDTSIKETDRLYPALRLLAWGSHNAEEAALAAMLETEGEA